MQVRFYHYGTIELMRFCLGSFAVWCRNHQMPFLGGLQWARVIVDLEEGDCQSVEHDATGRKCRDNV